MLKIIIFSLFVQNALCQFDMENVQQSLMQIGMRVFMDPSECSTDFQNLIKGVSNMEMWATSMLDANGKLPQGLTTFNAYEIGNFDQCVAISHDIQNRTLHGKHCMVSISVPKEILKKIPVYDLTMIADNVVELIGKELTYDWGFCAPKSCNASQLNMYFGDLIKQLTKFDANLTFTESHCRSNDGYEPEGYDIAIIAFLAILIGLVIMSTLYEIYTKEEKPKEILTIFSLRQNAKELLSIQAVDDTKLMFYTINGFKVFFMSWVLYVHITMMYLLIPALNINQVIEFAERWSGLILHNSVFVIDAFLYISGFLLAYIALRKTKGQLKIGYVPILIFDRYMRLIPVIFVTAMLFIFVGHIIRTSTVYNIKLDHFTEFCEDNWWINLLTIQNYYKQFNMCNPVSWYAAADFHLFVAGVVVLFLGGCYNILMYILPVVLIIASSASAMFTSAILEIPATLNLSRAGQVRAYLEDEHMKTHHRAAPFFIGILVGYYIYKRGGKKIVLNKVSVFFCWVASLVLIIGSGLSLHYFARKEHQFDHIIDPVYTGLHRIVFTIGLVILFVLCEYGYGGILEKILKFKYFQIYSRLTYSIFVIQLLYLHIVLTKENAIQNYSQSAVFNKYVSVHVVLIFFSALVYLCVELPFSKLSRLIIMSFMAKRKTEVETIEEGKTETTET